MRVHNFSYLLKEGIKNVFFNKLMSFACIGVLVACLLLIGGAVLVTLNVNTGVEIVEEQNEVVLFLSDRLGTSDIDDMNANLMRMDNIVQVRYIPKAQALEEYKNRMDEFADLFVGLDDPSFLPNYFVVRLGDLSVMQDTVAELTDMYGVDKVRSPTDVAEILTGLKQTVNYAGAGVVLILIVVSIVIITNTIKMTVFSRRREINIMKYVGATDGFIRLPFVVEGMIIGLIAAVVAFLALGFGYTYLLKWAAENYGDYLNLGNWLSNAVVFQDIALQFLGAFAIMGVFIGVVSSGIFVRRYLRV